MNLLQRLLFENPFLSENYQVKGFLSGKETREINLFSQPKEIFVSKPKARRYNYEARETKILIKQVKGIEVFNPYDFVLKYFVTGGKICKDAVQYIYGNKRGRSIKAELKGYKSILDNKKGSNIDELAHILSEFWQDEINSNEIDFREYLLEGLQDFNRVFDMCQYLIDKYLKFEQPTEYIPSSEEVEMITPYEDFQIETNEIICPF